MKVEFQVPGYIAEHEVEFIPRVGDGVVFGENRWDVMRVDLYPDSGRILITLITEGH